VIPTSPRKERGEIWGTQFCGLAECIRFV